MIKIVRFPGVVVKDYFYIFYELVERPFEGFKFPCNMQGEIEFNEMSSQLLIEYEKCESEEYEVLYRGLQRDKVVKKLYAVGQCWCGTQVLLQSAVNRCGCGKYYTRNGQETEGD